MNRRIALLALISTFVGVQTACRNTSRSQSEAAANWATPINDPSISNFHRVSDDLYRGAEPRADHFDRLRKMGIITVVNLRTDDRDRSAADAAHLRYEHIPMSAFEPRDEQVIRFLRLFSTSVAGTPVFVHCQHGADRTGLLCAMYRIVVQGWSKQDAIDEMTGGGMHYYTMLSEPVQYIRQADIERIRAEAGLTAHVEAAR